jgi:hypothetical protein
MPLLELIQALEKEKIQVMLRQNANGIIYGMTYVDHQTKCVFNGSELGKPYSANQMQERCNPKQVLRHLPRQEAPSQEQVPVMEQARHTLTIDPPDRLIPLLESEKVNNSLPYELRQDVKRKRKRKRLHL